MEKEKRCYSVKEIQDILEVSRTTVYELVKKNVFRWFLIGGKYVISKKSFDHWLDDMPEGTEDFEEDDCP